MKVQIVKINERDSYSNDEGIIGAVGIIDGEHDFREWYSGMMFFKPSLKVIINPGGSEGKIDSAYFYSVKIKRVK